MNATTIHIANTGYKPIQGIFCEPEAGDIYSIIKKKTKKTELEPKEALRILRIEKTKAQLKSLITKPVVIVPLSLVTAITGYLVAALAASSLAALVFGISAAITGSVALSLAIRFACDGTLHRISTNYADLAQSADDYIVKIKEAQKNHDKVEIKLGAGGHVGKKKKNNFDK